jgi:hypothetical protein
MTKTDLSKGMGHKMTFRVKSGLYNEPKTAEQMFEVTDDFEQHRFDDFTLRIGVYRHAVRSTEYASEEMALRGELADGTNTDLGAWLGRLKTEKALMSAIHKVNSENQVYAGRATMDTLAAADTLDWNEIITAETQLKRLGGKRARVGFGQNGSTPTALMGNVLLATSDSLYSLKTDADFKNRVEGAGVRGNGNYLFKGGFPLIDGQAIKEYDVIDHDGYGAIGSPLNPKAYLGEAIASGTSAFDIKGGGDATAAALTQVLYFKYFPNYLYEFGPGDTLAASGLTRYCLVINPPNAATDPNKVGMYAYTTGNNGNKITITQRLGPNINCVRHTTVGSVVWDTGIWSGVHTDGHPLGALVVPCNKKGQIFAHALYLGRCAMVRGYGKHRAKRGSVDKEDGFMRETYIRSYFGQTPRVDRRGRVPGILVVTHAYEYAGIELPTVV